METARDSARVAGLRYAHFGDGEYARSDVVNPGRSHHALTALRMIAAMSTPAPIAAMRMTRTGRSLCPPLGVRMSISS